MDCHLGKGLDIQLNFKFYYDDFRGLYAAIDLFIKKCIYYVNEPNIIR